MNDTLLIKAFDNGDKKVWPEIHDRFFYQVLKTIGNIIHNKERAEELAYDCFVKLFEKKPQFEAIQQLQAYLLKTAKNNALNYLKSTERKMDNSIELTAIHDTDENIETVMESEYERRRLVNEIILEIQKHPKERREVFELLVFGKKTALEVAAIKGINVSNVYDYRNKMRKELKKKFGADVDKLFP